MRTLFELLRWSAGRLHSLQHIETLRCPHKQTVDLLSSLHYLHCHKNVSRLIGDSRGNPIQAKKSRPFQDRPYYLVSTPDGNASADMCVFAHSVWPAASAMRTKMKPWRAKGDAPLATRPASAIRTAMRIRAATAGYQSDGRRRAFERRNEHSRLNGSCKTKCQNNSKKRFEFHLQFHPHAVSKDGARSTQQSRLRIGSLFRVRACDIAPTVCKCASQT
jgi:hypothetical protein